MSQVRRRVAIVGAGAWGTALAVALAARHDVVLWARDASQAAAMHGRRENVRYLAGIKLPPAILVTSGTLAPHLAGAALVVVATPMAALRTTLAELAGCTAPIVWLSKGLEPHASRGGLLGHEILADVAPQLRAGVLSGPSFALEVARAQPTALVVAGPDASMRQAVVDIVHGGALRIYENDDIAGVEVGGAVKNILAIATGLCDGMQLGMNARAALITRGLAEMTRFGVALGARSHTFMGLSGLGDLVLTATGDLSRNRRVGLLLAQGKTAQDAASSLGHVAEGVQCARAVSLRARQLRVEMPITDSVVRVLDGTLSPPDAVAALMSRTSQPE